MCMRLARELIRYNCFRAHVSNYMKVHTMKKLPVIVIALVPVLSGCQRSEEIVGEGNLSCRISEVSAYDYSQNHFFVDTLYRPLYEPYFVEEPPQVGNPAVQIVRQEVWVERVGIYPDPNEIQCRSFITLPARNGGYDPGLRMGGDTAGATETAPMVLLHDLEYSMMGDGYTGILTIDRPFTDNQDIAIAYRRADGTQFGEFIEDVSPESLYVQKRPLILHLVKPRQLSQNGRAWRVPWDMLVKSIYPLGSPYIGRNGFALQVVRRAAGVSDQTNILGHSLLNILGLDSYDPNGTPLRDGDGVFDFKAFRTIDPVRGEIIFPYIQPFDNGIQEYFILRGGSQFPDSTYLLPQIYDLTMAEARAMGKSTYVLQWRER
jgi:hypothetical protein